MERGDDTRGRILDCAWALAAERRTAEIAVGDVARAAGVSRQLVYFHFKSRAGLLDAMVRRHDHTAGFRTAVVAARAQPPVEALEALLVAWLRYVPTIHPVARSLEAAQIRGEEGGAAWADRMSDLRDAFRLAVLRLDEADKLAEGWTVERAAEWIWSRTHLDTWHHLVVECGWSEADFAERAVRSIVAEVAVPTDPPRQRGARRDGSRRRSPAR
jgi:AcrR family transcriptional regulator